MKYCENCGTQLDDETLFCGECGTKQTLNESEKVNEKPNKKLFIILIVILLLVVSTGAGAFIYKYKDNTSKKPKTEKKVEKEIVNNEAPKSETEKSEKMQENLPSREDMKAMYRNKLGNIVAENGYDLWATYTLYDIDKNGVEELIVYLQNEENSRYIYTIKDGAVANMGRVYCGSMTMLCNDNNGDLFYVFANDASMTIDKIIYNKNTNMISTSSIYNDSSNSMYDTLAEYKLQKIEEFDINDPSLLW